MIDQVDAAELALAQVDAIARAAIGWIAPIRFAIAQTEADRRAAYRLRYQVVIEHGWMQPDDLPDGLERDEYDDEATHILAWDAGVLVATSRLIFPRDNLTLPTEKTFGLTIEPRGQVVDAGRFVVARSHSSIEHRLLASLLGCSWLEVRARGYSRVCAAFASLAMMRVYRGMGAKMTALGPARYYWGADRYPILFDTVGAAASLVERWQPEGKGS